MGVILRSMLATKRVMVNIIALTATLTESWKDSKNKIIFKRRDDLQKFGFNFSFQGRVVPYMNFPKYVDI